MVRYFGMRVLEYLIRAEIFYYLRGRRARGDKSIYNGEPVVCKHRKF